MKINPKKCVACGNCTYICPMGAIYVDPELKRATINRDECVECYACYNGLSKEVLPPSTVRFVRRTAVQTTVHLITTGIILAMLAGVAPKLKLFGSGP